MSEQEKGKDWKKFYQVESQTYDQERFTSVGGKLFNELENEFIGELFGDVKNKRLLEVATGTGRISVHLAQSGAKVTALDLTKEMMDKAREKAKQAQVDINFVEGTALALPFADNSFDGVISIRFIHLLEKADEEAALREMVRVLKPSGVLIIEYNNLLYGGFLTPIIEFYRTRLLKRDAEKFILPTGIKKKFKTFGLEIEDVIGLGAPFLGRITKLNPELGHKLGKKLGRHVLKNFASQLVIKCRKKAA